MLGSVVCREGSKAGKQLLGKQTSSLTARPNTRRLLSFRMGLALFSTGCKVGAGADSSATSCLYVPTNGSSDLTNLARQQVCASARRSACSHGPNVHGACGGTRGYPVSTTVRSQISTLLDLFFPSLHPCNCIIARNRILHRNIDLLTSFGLHALCISAAQLPNDSPWERLRCWLICLHHRTGREEVLISESPLP